jgi:hypothetical protein
LVKKFVFKLSQTGFVHKAITERADLTAFKQRPTLRVILGVSAIGVSYIIGWPLIAVLGALSIFFKVPLLIVIGGPVAYLLSHLVFWLGMYLAGMRYSWIFIRWLTRITMIKLMKATDLPIPIHSRDLQN